MDPGILLNSDKLQTQLGKGVCAVPLSSSCPIHSGLSAEMQKGLSARQTIPHSFRISGPGVGSRRIAGRVITVVPWRFLVGECLAVSRRHSFCEEELVEVGMHARTLSNPQIGHSNQVPESTDKIVEAR